MDKDTYLKKIVIADRKRLEEAKAKIERMDESDAQKELLATIEAEIKINESLA